MLKLLIYTMLIEEVMYYMKIGALIYPFFSTQEITCLTSCLTVWFGEKIDYLAAEKTIYKSEEGFCVMPTKTFDEVEASEYDCIILPGIIDPLPALYEDKNIEFLRKFKDTDTLIASISSSPLLLAKAGLLDNHKFTAGFFMQMVEEFTFIKGENFIHKPIVEDGNIITAIGFAFREFAECVVRRLGFNPGEGFMSPVIREYTEEELTFYWEDKDYEEFKEEIKNYKYKGI